MKLLPWMVEHLDKLRKQLKKFRNNSLIKIVHQELQKQPKKTSKVTRIELKQPLKRYDLPYSFEEQVFVVAI